MVAWSTTDKSANITLSGGNLTATWSSNVQGGVRCDTSFAGGLLYFELYATSGSLGNLSVGFANATQSLAADVGSSINSVGTQPGSNFSKINGSSIGAFEHSTQQNTLPFTICIAANFTSGKYWARPMSAGSAGFWNGSTTADPGSGVGGWSLATLAAGPYFPMIDSINSNGAVVTVRFGAANMWFPIPAGFSTLDTNVQAFNATAKFDGIALLIAPKTIASAYKMLGQSILIAPQAVTSAYKIVGYAILRPRENNAPSRSRLAAYLRM